MGLPYFAGKTWNEITREERVYCAELYFHARKNVQEFVTLLAAETRLRLDAGAN